jgi:hypothetical protein
MATAALSDAAGEMETDMSKLSLITAAALVASIGALGSAPSAAETVSRISNRDAATSSCLSFNDYQPAEAVATVEDGLGDWIVWVRDKDRDVWMCNANAEGNVYANAQIRGDLLRGSGKRAIALQPVAHTQGHLAGAETAERLCAAAGRKVDATPFVTVEDGAGDHAVWLRGGDQSLWLCNASDKAELFVFERIRSPLNAGAAGPSFRAA